MEFPKVTENQFKERLGVCAVEKKITEIRCIWRETRNTDVGIDGQIEFVDNEGVCTGHIVAAQVKSGNSYLSKFDDVFVYFTPEAKHRHYWVNFPLPVVLFLHNPDTDETYWTDARRFLRSPENSGEATIKIPRRNILSPASREEFLEIFGTTGEMLYGVDDVINQLADNVFMQPTFPVSYLELFGLGLTDICNKLFFSMKLCWQIAEPKSYALGYGVSIGQEEYAFLESYIRFLISQNLIYYDLSDFLIDWEDRELVPMFLCPLTPRGIMVVERLHAIGFDTFHERFVSLDFESAPPSFEEIAKLSKKVVNKD